MVIRSDLPTHAQWYVLTSRCNWFDFGKRFYCRNDNIAKLVLCTWYCCWYAAWCPSVRLFYQNSSTVHVSLHNPYVQ